METFATASRDDSLDAELCRRIVDDLESLERSSAKRMYGFYVGVVWQTCGQAARARASFESIGVEDPWFSAARNNLGVLAHRAGEHGGAVARFEEALDVDPSMAIARRNLGEVHRQRYRDTGSLAAFEAARRHFQELLMRDVRDARAFTGLARLFYDRAVLGEPNYAVLAAFVISEARRLEGKGGTPSAELLDIEGMLALLDGEPSRALRRFEEAIAMDPAAIGPRVNAAHVLLAVRGYAEAERHLRVVSESGDERVEVSLGLGVARSGQGDFEGAKRAYEQAAALGPDDPRVDYDLGRLLLEWAMDPDTDDGHARLLRAARGHFVRFIRRSADVECHVDVVMRAQQHVESIDRLLAPSHPHPRREPEALRLEALQREQAAQEKARLLELERGAWEAWDARHSK